MESLKELNPRTFICKTSPSKRTLMDAMALTRALNFFHLLLHQFYLICQHAVFVQSFGFV